MWNESATRATDPFFIIRVITVVPNGNVPVISPTTSSSRKNTHVSTSIDSTRGVLLAISLWQMTMKQLADLDDDTKRNKHDGKLDYHSS